MVIAAELGVGEEEDGEDVFVGVPEVLGEEATEELEEVGESGTVGHQSHVIMRRFKFQFPSFNIQGDAVVALPTVSPVAEILGYEFATFLAIYFGDHAL